VLVVSRLKGNLTVRWPAYEFSELVNWLDGALTTEAVGLSTVLIGVLEGCPVLAAVAGAQRA